MCVVDVRVRPRSSVGILEEALDLTADLCTALFLHFSRISIKIVVAVSTTGLVLLQVVFMVWEIVLVISAW